MIFTYVNNLKVCVIENIDIFLNTFKSPEDLKVFNYKIECGDYFFEIPLKFSEKSNLDKKSYKIYFLYNLYKFILPNISTNNLCKLISEKHQLFMSQRQIDRHLIKFKKSLKIN